MPFTINEDSLLIRGRRGDTVSLTFDFGHDLSDYTIHFYIKKNISSSEPIIEKEFINPSSTSVTVDLTTVDTQKLIPQNSSYGTYYWGLKMNDGVDYAETIIPQEYKNPPMLFIYPGIGGV